MEVSPKLTYWACWWKATWVLFLIGCVLGYLNSREAGLATAIGAGLMAIGLGVLGLYVTRPRKE